LNRAYIDPQERIEKAVKMITEDEKQIITKCAKRYNVSYIILFGSSLSNDKEINDIDLAVKGIKPSLFFKFYAELFKNLSKPVDLIDLSVKSTFCEFVEETGVKIYGQTS
jgi:predicted nucleotidyltransferase